RTATDLFVAQVAKGDPSARPGAVVAPAADVVDGHAVRVSWTPADARATGFAVWRTERQAAGQSIPDGWKRVALVDGGASSWLDATVRPERPYSYALQALSDAGASTVSLPFAAATPATLTATIADGRVRHGWSSRTRREDRIVLRGTLQNAAGEAPAVMREGLTIIAGDVDWGTTILAVPALDPTWRPRGRSVVRWSDAVS